MCSIVRARGVNTLVQAVHINNICCARGAAHVPSRPCMQRPKFSHLKCLNTRWKSSAVFHRAGSSEGGGIVRRNNKLLGVMKEVPPTRGSGTEYDKNLKVSDFG